MNPSITTILQRYQGKGRAYLLPCLLDVQNVTGWLDEETCLAVAESLDVPPVQIHDVIEFYSLLYNKPIGKRVIRVCDDISCYLAGSKELIETLAQQLDVDENHGGVTADGKWSLEIHPCLGHCEQAPFLLIDEKEHGFVQPEQIETLLQEES